MKKLSFFIVAIILAATFGAATVQSVSAQQNVGVIVVDLQGDFTTLKNGSLAVNGTDQAFVEKVEKATEALKKKGYHI